MESPNRRSPRKPHCSPNRKYKCNYQNIKSGKCPGYIVTKRRRQTRSEAGKGNKRSLVYEVSWRRGVKQDARLKELNTKSGKSPAAVAGPKGYNYITRSKPTDKCIPRNKKGKIPKSVRDKPVNEYCQIYRSRSVRRQSGCVAENKSKRHIPNRAVTPTRSRSRSRSPTIDWNAGLRLSPNTHLSPIHSPIWQQDDSLPDFLR